MRAALALLICVRALAQDGSIPENPRELKFAPLAYTPPRAADFRHKLANGAVAYLVEDHDLPLINIGVLIRTGAFLDPPGKRGLAQLTGSQIRAGGTRTRPPAVFDEEAAFLAAGLGSGIGDLEGNASLNCLSKDIDAGLALFADMLRNPGFAEDRLKLARNQMLQAMERRNDSTESIEAREFQRLLRGAHFSAMPVTKATLEAITRDDLIDFHRRYYCPANFIFAVSGDFRIADMLARLEKAFRDWPNRTEPIPPVPKPDFIPKPGVYVVDKRDVNQGRVRMGHLGVMITNPDHLALSVMNGVLGGSGFTSRITSRVRSDEGLAYDAGSSFNHGNFYEGTFSVHFQSKNPAVAQAIAIVKEEIEKIRSAPVSEEELKTEVNYVIESFPRRFATAAARASQFASDEYIKLPADYWQRYRERIAALTPADIQRVARQYLHPDRMVTLVVGNLEAIRQGNPDRPQFPFPSDFVQIPLPDPLTMVYPN